MAVLPGRGRAQAPVIDPCAYTGDDPPGLETLEDCAWALLAEGAEVAASAFRLGTFCSTDERGHPEGCTMVLRHATGAGRRLTAHADLRAPRVADVHLDARTSWLFYDPRRGIQVRVAGHTRVLAGEAPAVAAAWDGLSVAERRAYQGPTPAEPLPFAGLAGPGPGWDPGADPWPEPWPVTRAGPAAGRANFGLLEMQAGVLDILLLGVLENTHARLLYGANGAVVRQWISR